MSVSRETMEAFGCYLNAGYLDHYNGTKHTRVALVLPSGDLVWEPGGAAYARDLAVTEMVEAYRPADNVGRADNATTDIDAANLLVELDRA
jgi:hypothetical protein